MKKHNSVFFLSILLGLSILIKIFAAIIFESNNYTDNNNISRLGWAVIDAFNKYPFYAVVDLLFLVTFIYWACKKMINARVAYITILLSVIQIPFGLWLWIWSIAFIF